MSDPAKLMTEAKAVLERAKQRLAKYDDNLGDDEALIYDLGKVLAAIVAQEEARWGKETAGAGPAYLISIEEYS